MLKAAVFKVFFFMAVLFLTCVQTVLSKVLLRAESAGMSFEVEQVKDALGVPWGRVFFNPEEILFTERAGKAGILVPESGKVTWLKGFCL